MASKRSYGPKLSSQIAIFLDIRGLTIPMDINEITYLINGAVFEVNKVLGPGFLEKVYPVK